jgi:hypothetical protein
MLNRLLESALVLVVSFAVRWFFDLIGVAIDEATFNSIVAGLVALLLGLFGVDLARAALLRFAPVKYHGLLEVEK